MYLHNNVQWSTLGRCIKFLLRTTTVTILINLVQLILQGRPNTIVVSRSLCSFTRMLNIKYKC